MPIIGDQRIRKMLTETAVWDSF